MAAPVDNAERRARILLSLDGGSSPTELLGCCTSAGRRCTSGTAATAPMG